MKYLVTVLVFIAVAIGITGVVLGEADDSPGLQGLGALVVVGAVVGGVLYARRGKK